jgi:hypothetical protein
MAGRLARLSACFDVAPQRLAQVRDRFFLRIALPVRGNVRQPCREPADIRIRNEFNRQTPHVDSSGDHSSRDRTFERITLDPQQRGMPVRQRFSL